MVRFLENVRVLPPSKYRLDECEQEREQFFAEDPSLEQPHEYIIEGDRKLLSRRLRDQLTNAVCSFVHDAST